MSIDSTEGRAIAALWYAWGQIDAGKYPALDINDGFAFQTEQKAKAHAYYVAESTFYLSNMLDDWRKFAEARTAAIVLAVNA